MTNLFRTAARLRGDDDNSRFETRLFTIHFSLFTIHYSLFTLHYSLFTIHYSLFTIHYSLFTIHYSLFTLHSSLFTLHSSLFTLHCSLFTSSTIINSLPDSASLHPGYTLPFHPGLRYANPGYTLFIIHCFNKLSPSAESCRH